jgi:hypothetical protein
MKIAKYITRDISISQCIQILLQIYASFYLLKTMYPGYFNILSQYFNNCKEHISLSKYIYYFDRIIKNKSVHITLLNIPVILYLIHQYESNKSKDKQLQEKANILYKWCTEFNKKHL